MEYKIQQHPELERENSLSSPEDRIKENNWRPDQDTVLTDEETIAAMKELNNNDFTEKFRKVDRNYAEPPPLMQNIGLISFTPAKGSSPNKNGVYGFAKLRGNFATELEANQRAEYLIKNIDSYHQIYHTYVGRPFPITTSSKFSKETTEIEMQKEIVESVSNNIKNKKKDDYETIKEIKQREQQLLQDTKVDKEDDPYETYITLQVKKAQLSWTYQEHQKKLKEVKDVIIKTRVELKDLDQEFPTFKDQYYEKYMKARNDAGLTSAEDKKNSDSNFIKFLVEDVDLGF